MNVTAFKTSVVELPFERPIATSIHDMRSVGCVLLSIETDEGLTGESYVFTLNAARIRALLEMIRGFEHLVVGNDPLMIEAIWQRLWQAMNPLGHKGISVAALSAIDTACWDIVGKAAALPLHKVFGGWRESVPTYASGGLWLSQSIDDCVRQAHDFVAQGFRAMKIRLGSARIADDVARVREIRAAVGHDIELLTDANQGLTVKHAIRLGQELAAFDIGWLEEPVPYNDLKGHAEVRAALSIPIASGETEYSRFGMRDIIAANAVDVLMPDLQRIGGLSEFRRASALASAHHVPVSSHIFTEQSICLAAADSNCISVEHMPWFTRLFNEPMEIRDGELVVPQRAGIGFTFDRAAVRHFALV